MDESNTSNEFNSQHIIEKLSALESRISRIEAKLRLISSGELYEREREEDYEDIRIKKPKDAALESNLVEYGLSWLSTIAFIFGVIFLMSYVRNLGYPILAIISGYVAATGLFIFTYLFRNSLSHIIKFLNTCGILLVYIVTLRLHFFTPEPIIDNSGIALLLIIISLGALVWYSIKRRSEFLSFLSILLILITGIISDTTYITLSFVTAATGLSLFYSVKFTWWRQVIAAIFLVYLTHLTWLLSNPFMGHTMKFVEFHQYNIVFLFMYGLIFSSTIIVLRKDKLSDNILGFISILNAMNFSLLILLLTLVFYKENYTGIFATIALLCLIFSVYLKYKNERLFAPAFYACFGFMALSVFIYGFANLPDSYYWLALQSLIVVSMALWFRSKLIVVVNTLLYILILIIYLVSSPSSDSINFVFAIVALITARILNWKKDRLTLKTEIYRNIYLIVAFFIVLYGLNHAVPTQYVTLTWTGAAIIYLLLSIFLKNIKYRWMAFMTLVFTGGHLLFVDMAQMEMGYKVIAFLVFAAISIGLTMYYIKWIKNKSSADNDR
jgi:hypothetical protein